MQYYINEEAKKLFYFLVKYGGKIISSNDLHPDLIKQAQAADRMYVDEKGLGFIWEPPFAGRFPETEEEVKMFEWCYPLDAELPKHIEGESPHSGQCRCVGCMLKRILNS